MTAADDKVQETPRILPLAPEEMSSEEQALAARLRSVFGLSTDEIPKVMLTMIRHPVLYRAQMDYFAKRTESLISDARLREIAILRMSWLCRSAYLWGEHVKLGKKAGLSSDDIERITQGAAEPGWSVLEAALICAVDELREKATISDANWDILAAELSEAEIIELLILIGDHQEAASIYNALRLELIPGNPGLSAR